ncbi:hypothetical protein [Legionella gresilensis]|uniref:hypothetical protein n=1 Tax=Legionella gresilensis TaxID=91823 RepID=UPI0010419667|nr:hypothetical protein [Legionella gresilensis]
MYLIRLFTSFFTQDIPLNNHLNSLPQECWVNILEYLQKDEEINTLRLVSTKMQHLSTLTEAGKNYYQRKDAFFNTYDKVKAISQKDNNYAHFFDSHLNAQVTQTREQLTTPSNKFGLFIYFDNSLQLDEEKAYLAEQLGTFNGSFLSSRIYSSSYYNYPTHYFYAKRSKPPYLNSNKFADHIFNQMDANLKIYSPIYNNVILIFTIDATESNRFIKLLIENKNKNKYQSKMPFFIVISLNPQIKIEEFDYPILKLFFISSSYRERIANAFFLNDIHPDLWTNTCHRYNYYYRQKMENIVKEIENLLGKIIDVKESLEADSGNQFTNRM